MTDEGPPCQLVKPRIRENDASLRDKNLLAYIGKCICGVVLCTLLSHFLGRRVGITRPPSDGGHPTPGPGHRDIIGHSRSPAAPGAHATVDRETYRKRYEEEVHKDSVPFFPVAARKDMVGMSVVILAVLACAALFGPYGPNGAPDPTITDASPRPDFYFLPLFALLALLPPWTETAILLVGMPLAIVLLFAVPAPPGPKGTEGTAGDTAPSHDTPSAPRPPAAPTGT